MNTMQPIVTTGTEEQLEARRKATGRQCGSCTMCCYILGVDAPPDVSKPPDVWCKHCKPSKGCAIYERRPMPCRHFYCQWLLDLSLDDLWYPARSKIVINLASNPDGSNAGLVFEVDPRRPDHWLQHPYVQRISNLALLYRGTTVRVGNHWYMLVPRNTHITLGSGVAKIIPGKIGPGYIQTAMGDFEWIEVVPTDEARNRMNSCRPTCP